MTELAIHPLTPERWDDFVSLFGADSVTRMCWCMSMRLTGAELRQHSHPARQKLFGAVVKKGPPPGLLAYKGKEPVGWIAIAPRAATPDWNRGRKSSAVENESDATDPGVWGATCFFVRAGHRKQGMTAELLEAATVWARDHGATRIEGCPMSHDDKRSAVGMCVGPLRVFERQGFQKVLERKAGRPLMRLDIRKKAPKKIVRSARPDSSPLPLVGRGGGGGRIGVDSADDEPRSRNVEKPPTPAPLPTRGRGKAGVRAKPARSKR